ncbi:MAG TPA: bifunctional phosphoribosyl-AMP cyclohydrolase/phosphoribosyl-ATP diphosphatase HisIE [Myxococcaceae bacterium]|jgi:phosphoribosyl-ATP pyrophosphohydrolase/phosphoribosyl-AMP cyclohydrolase
MTLDFEKGGGRVTVVTRDARTGAVLMVAHADREAIARTEATGEMHYTSRTRGLWRKGETSGNTQKVVLLTPDCDSDAVLADVVPAGPACHDGTVSCFREAGEASGGFARLDAVVRSRAEAGEETSYTRKLLADRNLRLKKLGEETAEFVTACADGDAARATEEAADVVYHLTVALRALGVGLGDVAAALARRAR